jgi:tetratricopeptide (TPR) repeat protein
MDPATLGVVASVVGILAFLYAVLLGQRSLADLLARWRPGHETGSQRAELARAKLEFSQQKYPKVTERLTKLGVAPDLDPESRAEALLHLAEAEAYSGKPDRAKEHSEAVLALLRGLRDIPAISPGEAAVIGEALNLLGFVCRLHGEWDRALEFYKESLELCMEQKERARVLNNIGNIYRLKGEFDRALTYCKHSLVIRKREESKEPEHHFGLSLNTLGMVYRDIGDVRQAMRLFAQAVDVFREAKHVRGKGLTCINLGNMRRLTGDHKQASQFLEEAQRVFEDLGDASSLAEVFNEVGRVHRDQGELQEAEDNLLTALEIAGKKGDAFRRVDSLEDLSEVYYQSGNLDGAEEKARQARELAQKHGYSLLESNCLRNLGNVAFARGQVREAFSFYAEACLVATSYNFPLYRRHLDRMESRCLELPESQFQEIGRYLLDFWRERGMAGQYPEFVEKCECILMRRW